MQVQAQKDAYAAHQMKELHARHASLRHSLKALHAAYTQLRLRLEDMVGHLLTPEAQCSLAYVLTASKGHGPTRHFLQ